MAAPCPARPRSTVARRARAPSRDLAPLGDAELLALVLEDGRAAPPDLARAAELLGPAGLGGLARRGLAELTEAHGLDERRALRLHRALELGRRALVQRLGGVSFRLCSFEAVVQWARPRLVPLEHEEVWLLALDGRSGLKSGTRLAQGGLHGCALVARDVLRAALREAASAIVLVHNHPSGDPTPSAEDVTMTRTLARACDAVGVPLLDHVVVARAGAASLAEQLFGSG